MHFVGIPPVSRTPRIRTPLPRIHQCRDTRHQAIHALAVYVRLSLPPHRHPFHRSRDVSLFPDCLGRLKKHRPRPDGGGKGGADQGKSAPGAAQGGFQEAERGLTGCKRRFNTQETKGAHTNAGRDTIDIVRQICLMFGSVIHGSCFCRVYARHQTHTGDTSPHTRTF